MTPSIRSFCLVLLVLSGDWRVFGQETIDPASVRFDQKNVSEIPDFQRHVVPLLGRLGCNGRSCHGSFQGQGDLRLSLFGYDFKMDHEALTGKATSIQGSRLDRQRAEQSLVLRKPTMQIDHEGGERFSRDAWEYRLIERWIQSGAKGVSRPRELASLEIEPQEIVFGSALSSAQLRVLAVWEDGQREDVTPLCRFRTNDDSIVEVDRDGKLKSVGPGDTHVIAFYDNGVAAVSVLRPVDSNVAQRQTDDLNFQGIDDFVSAKLTKLGITPSVLCEDTEFLRRVSIDLTGTLPSPQEVESFLADSNPDKRVLKIDELLSRPAYAAWWANKLCDFTGCNPRQQAELGQETSVQWYMWIFSRLKENTPYDELVGRIVLAQGRQPGQSYEDYAAGVSAYFVERSPADFTQRETMPHYWTRSSMRKPEEAAQAFAHNFLGIRLQCAQCHKHPFAMWTQDDFQEFSRFFQSVQFGVAPDAESTYRQLAQAVGLRVNGKEGAAIRNDTLRQARQGKTLPWRELYVSRRAQPETLRLLRSRDVRLAGSEDPREPIMTWMEDPKNPWFAKAFVNRVWAAYFYTGIIDPPDDLNLANPPSHPALLQWLVRGFVDHNYDMKWLHRQILSSDTYQRSWKPNSTNREDRRNFSRNIPRRMPAEVVYDSVKQALVASEQLDEVRTDLTRRAIGHLSMRLAGTYAMEVFGKPDRAINCDCERVNQPTLLQAVFLQNDPLVEQRLDDSGWLMEISKMEVDDQLVSNEKLVRLAWLRTLGRPPSVEETARALTHIQSANSITDGIRDLMWALLNTKEFVLLR